MNRVECNICGEIVEVTGSSVVFPYVCSACLGDDTYYADEEEDNIPCDATTYYIVEARGKFNKSYVWFRSQNPDTNGIFDDYSTALEAAEQEQGGSIVEYRVVEYRPESTPCDAPYNSGVPCQSALDSVQEELQEEQYLDPYCVGKTDPRVHAMHSGDILDQFDADTELINGLTTENDDLKMKLSQANLNIQIQGEIIADLENTVGAYRVIFRIPGC